MLDYFAYRPWVKVDATWPPLVQVDASFVLLAMPLRHPKPNKASINLK